MDSTTGTIVKRSKVSIMEGQDITSNLGEDIISNLPEVIIGHILSLVPIEDAIRTSVLSNKWKYMWTFITKLHFDDTNPSRHNKTLKTLFSNFVYKVLLHLSSSRIQSFSLSISEKYDSCHVNQWISAVLKRGVKEFFIHSRKKLDIFSHPLLRSQCLETLVLNMHRPMIRKHGCAMRVPTYVCLSSLIVLKLSDITFSCDPSNVSQNVTLNFPMLREYETDNCTWLNIKGVTFEVPLLEVLLIKQTMWSTHVSSTIIKFSAHRLSKFSYDGFVLPIQDSIMLDLSTSCTVSANIYLHHHISESLETTTNFASEILKQLHNNVECLKFERLEVLELAQDDLPTFGMLSSLYLQEVTGEILLKILRNTPFLKTLILQELLEFGEELSVPENVPSCFISNLEVVKFGELTGAEDELCFAEFVMEHAQVLKKASFSTRSIMHRIIFEKFKKKLFSFSVENRSVSSTLTLIEFSFSKLI